MSVLTIGKDFQRILELKNLAGGSSGRHLVQSLLKAGVTSTLGQFSASSGTDIPQLFWLPVSAIHQPLSLQSISRLFVFGNVGLVVLKRQSTTASLKIIFLGFFNAERLLHNSSSSPPSIPCIKFRKHLTVHKNHPKNKTTCTSF